MPRLVSIAVALSLCAALPAFADTPAGGGGKDSAAPGEIFDPSPANIERRTRRYTLADGMRVALLARPTYDGTVAGTLVLNTGDLASLAGKQVIGTLTASMLMRGAGTLSGEEIRDRLARLKAKLDITGTAEEVTASFETTRDKLPELLDLIATILCHPTFTDAELERQKTQTLAALDERRQDPQGVAFQALLNHAPLYPEGDVRHGGTFDDMAEAVKAVTPAEVRAFHAEFYGTDNAQLALVGDFDQGAVETRLASLFGDWKAARPYARVPRPYAEMTASFERIEMTASKQSQIFNRTNGFYIARLSVPLREDDPAMAALTAGNYILGGGGPGSRLRPGDRLAYGVGSRLWPNSFEPNSGFILLALCEPGNVATLKTAIDDEVKILLRDGVTDQELAEAKTILPRVWLTSRTRNPDLAAQLAAQLKLGQTMSSVEQREKRFRELTREEVDEALRRYFDTGRLVQIYAGDFAQAAAKESTGGH